MKIKLYDPHPGFGGAIMALPKRIKALIDTMDSEETTMEECLHKLREAAKDLAKQVTIQDTDRDYIQLRLESETGFIHSWRLLRYKKC